MNFDFKYPKSKCCNEAIFTMDQGVNGTCSSCGKVIPMKDLNSTIEMTYLEASTEEVNRMVAWHEHLRYQMNDCIGLPPHLFKKEK